MKFILKKILNKYLIWSLFISAIFIIFFFPENPVDPVDPADIYDETAILEPEMESIVEAENENFKHESTFRGFYYIGFVIVGSIIYAGFIYTIKN